MREHPIPQDVTGYRFHIIGNLTLKQFVEVAGGVVVGFIIYKIGLPTIIKWPLIAFVVSLGGLGAFLPIAGRSFDQWVITFFKTIYKPTRYFWKKEAHIPDYFTYQSKTPNLAFEPQVDLAPQKHQRVDEFLTSVNYQQQTTPNQPATNEIDLNVNQPEETNPYQEVVVNTATTPTDQNLPTQDEPQAQNTQATTQPDQPIQIEATEESPTTNNTTSDQVLDEKTTQKQSQDLQTATINAISPPTSNQNVIFNQDLPFPTQPTTPNKIVGMILTKDNDLVPNAIVEIYNQTGMVERAVKTNALGQFFITTPLPNGNYVLQVTHDTLSFEPVNLQLTGQIVPPLEIVAS